MMAIKTTLNTSNNNEAITRTYPFEALPAELKASQIEFICQQTLAKFAEATKNGTPIEVAVSEGDFNLKHEFLAFTNGMSWEQLYNRESLFLCMMMIKAGRAFTQQMRTRAPSFISAELNECTCRNPVARNNTDSFIIREIEKRFPNKNNRLTYVSFGSDGCFSDWVILSQLSLLGYKHIDIHLTAPKKTSYDKMVSFFSNLPGTDYKVYNHDKLRDFSSLQKPCDILLALDFNGDIDKGAPVDLRVNDNGFALCATNGSQTNPNSWPNWQLQLGTKAHKLFREWKKEG